PRPFLYTTCRQPRARRRDCADRKSQRGGAPRGSGRPSANCGPIRKAHAEPQLAALRRIRLQRARRPLSSYLWLVPGLASHAQAEQRSCVHVELTGSNGGDRVREDAMQGLMSERPLLVSSIIKHAAVYHRDTEIVSRTVEGRIHRYTYGEAERRCKRLARAL